MGILDGLIKGIGGIASSAIGAVGGFLGQQDANEANREIAAQNTAFNAAEAQRQRDFESYWVQQSWGQSEKWRGNAYQTAVADMQKAGLNPMLAYSQGGAAVPTPGVARGSAATAVQPAPMLNKFAAASQAAQTIANVQLQESQVERTQAETRNIDVDTQRRQLELPHSREYVIERQMKELVKLASEANISRWDQYLVEKYLRLMPEEQEKMREEIGSTRALRVIRELDQVGKRAEAEYWKDVGKGGVYWREGRAAAGTLLGIGTGFAAKRALGQGLRVGPRSYRETEFPLGRGGRYRQRVYDGD